MSSLNHFFAGTIVPALVLLRSFVIHLAGHRAHSALNHPHRLSHAPLPTSAQSLMIGRSFVTLVSTALGQWNQKLYALLVIFVTKAVFSRHPVLVAVLTVRNNRNHLRVALLAVAARSLTIELTFVIRPSTAQLLQNFNFPVLLAVSARSQIFPLQFLALQGSFAMLTARNQHHVRLVAFVQEAHLSPSLAPGINTLHQVGFALARVCVCVFLRASFFSFSHRCSANATSCLSCPDGSVCKSGILIGPKPPRNKTLGPGVIAAIVVASIITSIARAYFIYLLCDMCFSRYCPIRVPPICPIVQSDLSPFVISQSFVAEVCWPAGRWA